MNKLIIAVAATAFLTAPSSLLAQDPGTLHFGLMLGQTRISEPDDIRSFPGVEIDGGSAMGFSAGYQIDGNWTAEFEYVQGEFEISGPAATIDGEVDSIALYANFRSGGELYILGKIGIIRRTLSSDIAAVPDETDSGSSLGIGGGYRLSNVFSIEAAYSRVDEDTNWLLVSARYSL